MSSKMRKFFAASLAGTVSAGVATYLLLKYDNRKKVIVYTVSSSVLLSKLTF